MALMKHPYAHWVQTEAHILPNSDTFDIISKCFWAESRSVGVSAPSLQRMAISAFRTFFSRPLEEPSEHSNGADSEVVVFKIIVPLPEARSARPSKNVHLRSSFYRL